MGTLMINSVAELTFVELLAILNKPAGTVPASFECSAE